MPAFQTENILPNLSIDCVIFGFHDAELKVLLLKLKNLQKWALPGGFVEIDKDVDQEASNVLKKRTGLENIFLQQFYLFGDVNRNEKGHATLLVDKKVIEADLKSWFEKRFVSIGYYALVEYSKVKKPTADYISELCEWCPLSDLPDMILDHREILLKAHQTLKRELNAQPVGLKLLPDLFTMTELQTLYETILERKLDRRNFRRKILSYDILLPTNKRRRGVKHKAPALFEFDEKKYFEAIERGLNPGF